MNKNCTAEELIMLAGVILGFVVIAFTGCARQEIQQKRWQSSMHGLQRTIIQYSYDGKELNRWHGKFVVDVDSGDVCIRAMNLDTNKVYLITPPFVVSED